jgi:hypothetical protein
LGVLAPKRSVLPIFQHAQAAYANEIVDWHLSLVFDEIW